MLSACEQQQTIPQVASAAVKPSVKNVKAAPELPIVIKIDLTQDKEPVTNIDVPAETAAPTQTPIAPSTKAIKLQIAKLDPAAPTADDTDLEQRPDEKPSHSKELDEEAELASQIELEEELTSELLQRTPLTIGASQPEPSLESPDNLEISASPLSESDFPESENLVTPKPDQSVLALMNIAPAYHYSTEGHVALKHRWKKPKRIALAVPLNGRLAKVGEAVLDGFMAAQFETNEKDKLPTLKIYDTTNIDKMDTLYQQALNDDIDLIIGPIDKTKVQELSQIHNLQIPTLALNYFPLEKPLEAPANLVQFGLAIEDEALQLAVRAKADGHQRIIIMHQNQPWATRAADNFRKSFASLGGKVAKQMVYSGAGDHSEAITNALLISQSKARASELQSDIAGTGNKVKFEPRRRQDIDAIVLFSMPQDGRQIIPTLAFHYASDLPVYASHHIYQGPTKDSRDKDLDKVVFTDLPWLIKQIPLRKQVSKTWLDKERYTRLFALGLDAHQLYPKLNELSNDPSASIEGMTGNLKMNSDNRIVSQRSWGRFKSGKVVSAESVGQ